MNKITVKNVEINITGISDEDYISLTDLAKLKNEDMPNDVIRHWLRRVDTLNYLHLWETLNNPNFKQADFGGFKSRPGENAFIISPQKWVQLTNAIGIKVNLVSNLERSAYRIKLDKLWIVTKRIMKLS